MSQSDFVSMFEEMDHAYESAVNEIVESLVRQGVIEYAAA